MCLDCVCWPQTLVDFGLLCFRRTLSVAPGTIVSLNPQICSKLKYPNKYLTVIRGGEKKAIRGNSKMFCVAIHDGDSGENEAY